MPGPTTNLQELCQELIEQLVSPETLAAHRLSTAGLTGQIADIVTRNQGLNRVERVTQQLEVQAPPVEETVLTTYIAHVIVTYLKERQRIELLAQGQEQAWAAVINFLMPRAIYALRRWQPDDYNVYPEAVELVQETSAQIYNNAFPFDVPFEAWALKILNNLVLKKFTRSRDLIDRRPASVTSLDHAGQSNPDQTAALYEFIADETSPVPFEQVEQHEWLITAIECLRSGPQQQVIILSYFHDLDDDDIALRIGKSKNAVQILRHRALQRLKIILETDLKESDDELQ